MEDCAHAAWLYRTAEIATDIFLPTRSISIPGPCQSCSKKIRKKRWQPQYAVDDIVAQIPFPTTQQDTTYQTFIARNQHDILQAVDQHTRRHG